jgi:hypothetical protein
MRDWNSLPLLLKTTVRVPCTHTQAATHTHTHTHTFIHARICKHTKAAACTRVHKCTYTHAHAHKGNSMHTHTRTYTNKHANKCSSICTHRHTHYIPVHVCTRLTSTRLCACTTQSGFFSGSSTRSPIGFEPFVRETLRNGAPPDVVSMDAPCSPHTHNTHTLTHHLIHHHYYCVGTCAWLRA